MKFKKCHLKLLITSFQTNLIKLPVGPTTIKVNGCIKSVLLTLSPGLIVCVVDAGNRCILFLCWGSGDSSATKCAPKCAPSAPCTPKCNLSAPKCVPGVPKCAPNAHKCTLRHIGVSVAIDVFYST